MIEKHIRADALLSRQLQWEEREQVLKQNNQKEYDVPSVYHINRPQLNTESNDEEMQDTDYKLFVRTIMADQPSNYHNRQEVENPTLNSTLRIFSGKVQFTNRECNRGLL